MALTYVLNVSIGVEGGRVQADKHNKTKSHDNGRFATRDGLG